MITLYEEDLFADFGNWYVEEVKKAILTKPIKRKSLHNPDGFEAVVNASGRLHDSIHSIVTEEAIEVYALSYIDNLIYGQPPGASVQLTEIEQWLEAKGLDYNPRTVTKNIRQVGTSIWNEFNGENSGLLLDIPVAEKIEEMKSKLMLRSIDEVKHDLISQLAA
jgi:hypothetical protein